MDYEEADKAILEKLSKALEQSGAGEVENLGSFCRFCGADDYDLELGCPECYATEAHHKP